MAPHLYPSGLRPCLFLATLQAGSFLATSGIVCDAADAPSCEQGAAERTDVAFMQLASTIRSVGHRGARSPPSIPRARTLLSTNASASAHFMTEYMLAAKPFPLAECSEGKRAAVELSLMGGEKVLYVFIEEQAGGLPELVSQASRQWSAANEHDDIDLDEWLNNHDAFPYSAVDLAKLTQDGVPMSKQSVLRVDIPFSLWTLEFTDLNEYPEGYVLGPPVFAGTGCRDIAVKGNYARSFRKATYLSADPEAAAFFAVDILGASLLRAPYPWPPEEGCTAARWVELPSGVQMHFVLPPDSSATTALASFVETSRANAIASGTLALYMYNSLVLEVPSLDPFVTRLRSRGYSFTVLPVAESEFGLFTDIQGTGSAIQLRSKHISEETPASSGVDMCLEHF